MIYFRILVKVFTSHLKSFDLARFQSVGVQSDQSVSSEGEEAELLWQKQEAAASL